MSMTVARFSLTAPRYWIACCLLVAGMALPQGEAAAGPTTDYYQCHSDDDSDEVYLAIGLPSTNWKMVCPAGSIALNGTCKLTVNGVCTAIWVFMSSPASGDNCPTVSNADQADADGDKIGDVCDTDEFDNDSDGFGNFTDNCSLIPNADQLDTDGDGKGNVCDIDDDNDGVSDGSDAFPLDASETIDADKDGVGDNADTDDDNDGVADNIDNCRLIVNPDQLDTDGDAQGNVCDSDDDNDGVLDGSDKYPLDASESLDTDNDGIGNNADTDDDNDGLLDVSDNCPLNSSASQLDTDGDGKGDVCDTDDDNDGISDQYGSDKFPLNAAASSDSDNDGFPDSWNAACDAACQSSSGLALDNCAWIANASQLNADGDGQGNACDSDDDNDGVPDASDTFPLDASESLDTDNDGIGNNADTDDDGDGVPDVSDVFPLQPEAALDADHDGMPDAIASSFLIEDFESAGFSGQPWVMGGSAAWTITNSTQHAGAFSARSGAITHLQSSSLQVTKITGNSVSFWFSTSSVSVYDKLKFYVDGVLIKSWSGTLSWQEYTGAVTAGSHVLKWEYSRDASEYSAGQDAVWIDDINFGTNLIEDQDDDNDGVPDASDAFPLDAAESTDTDGDGIGNNADSTPNGDTDGDGIDNLADNCPSVSNADQLNSDGDSEGSACDNDDDNDGVPDVSDAFPLDASESADTDGDGIGNNADSTPNGDTDGDGVDNGADNCVAVANADQLNSDGDSQGNACDADNDNDGVPDASDAFPLDSAESTDTDGDGIGDNTDNCVDVANADQLNTDGDVQGDVCDVFVNDPTLLLQQNGTAKNEKLGSSVALADMNNDGVVDLLVGTPLANATRNGTVLKKAGQIQIVSGKDNSVLRIFNGSATNEQLGAAMAVVSDQNKDGVRDVVVGDPLADVTTLVFNGFPVLKDAGRVLLYSGLDGRMLRILAEGKNPGDHFGAAVAVGDVNGDSKADLIVGAPRADAAAKDAGQVTVFNGLSKKILYQRNGEQAGENFGAAVAINNVHLFVGAPLHDTLVATNTGRVSIFNSSEGGSSALFTLNGAANGDSFGSAITAANDGWAVGAPLADSAGKDAGSVQVFAGLNATPVKTLNGATAGDNIGSALNMQGDVNKDGTNDIAIGAAKFDINTATLLKDAGRVEVLSGAGISL